MAGNANSGNRNGRNTLTDRVRKAMTRAIKQGDEGINGQRALSDLLAELMQTDVARFIQITGPFIPKEIIFDQSISITVALEEARHRIINHQLDQSLSNDAAPTLSLDHPQSSLCDAFNLEGDGAGLVRGSSS